MKYLMKTEKNPENGNEIILLAIECTPSDQMKILDLLQGEHESNRPPKGMSIAEYAKHLADDRSLYLSLNYLTSWVSEIINGFGMPENFQLTKPLKRRKVSK